jgi:two-component system, chemotaxis family, protein-glutamate methylesterase/glutaminase
MASFITERRVETMNRVRVLIVDDSAFARKVLREVLSARPEVEIVGIARDGLEALELISTHHPDVVTLDLVMPNLDGLGVLRALPKQNPPKIVVVSISEANSELGIEALECGAVDVVHKPTTLATSRLYELSDELVEKVLFAARARPRLVPTPAALTPRLKPLTTSKSCVVIGTSTGGPAALRTLLPGLPKDFALPVLVALHIPAGYTHSLAQRLASQCAIAVKEAEDGEELRPGTVLICPGGQHLALASDGDRRIVSITGETLETSHAPSIDALFTSAAKAFGPRALGVVLTGMGNDGLEGSRAIVAAGGEVLSESESTAVIYGMPRVVSEAKLAAAEVPLDHMAEAIIRYIS